MKNLTTFTLPLQTGDHVQWNTGEGQVLEDHGEMIEILIEKVSGYTVFEIERTKLHFINE